MISRVQRLLFLASVPLFLFAQERQVALSGLFNVGYSNSRTVSRFVVGPRTDVQDLDTFWGLDLSLRTYVLDPRFIALTFEPSFLRSTERFDSTHANRANTGGNFYLDFLRESYYPFRFHFIDHNLDYEQRRLASSTTARRSTGFEWILRKPKRPPVFVNYDSTEYDYEFAPASTFQNRTKTFATGTHGVLGGWQTNATFSKASSVEAFTGLATALDFLNGSARRDLSPRSNISIGAVYQSVHFTPPGGGPRQDLPFFNFRSDLSTRHSEKLSTRFFHQFYRSGRSLASGGGRQAVPATVFDYIGGQVSYRLIPSITVGESTEVTFTNILNPRIESATRFVTTVGTVNWQRRIKFLETRAGYQRGLSYVRSNFGNTRGIPFDGYSAGLALGDPRYVRLSGDYSLFQRPEIFEIGGRFQQRNFSGTVETRALKRFQLRASAGKNDLNYLALRGRERYNTRTYSLAIVHRKFDLVGSRSADVGLRTLLLSPIALDPNVLFRRLPLDALLSQPFSATTAVNTGAFLTLRPVKAFDLSFRYLRQRILFPVAPALFLNQYEIAANYRLGKFIFSAGGLYYDEDINQFSAKRRGYYYFRIARHFRIL